MSRKNALIFVDGVVKVVFGNSVKVIRPEDVGLAHNRDFLGKLFAEHRVLFVDRAAEMSMDEFMSGIEAKAAKQPDVGPPASAIANTPQRQAPSRLPPVTRPPAMRPEPAQRQSDPSGQWVKSNAKTIIIIDDLLTDEELAPGIKRALALHPGRVANLGALDQERVAASQTLRRLIQNGTISLSNPDEAMALDMAHDERVQRENDARLDQYAPIMESSARDFAANPSYDMHGASMMEITDDAPSRASPEDSGSMTDLMSMIADDAGVDPAGDMGAAQGAAPARRQLAARPKAEVNPEATARGIRRKND